MKPYDVGRKNPVPWTRSGFVFCFLVIWAAALFQGYAVYQEWMEEKAVRDAFKVLGVSRIERCEEEGDTVFTLKGYRQGQMTLSERKEAADKLFHSLSANVVEAVREEELYTVYGYSPLFHRSVCYGENEINLNLAFSYNEIEKETMVYLAAPFLQIDY